MYYVWTIGTTSQLYGNNAIQVKIIKRDAISSETDNNSQQKCKALKNFQACNM